MKRRISTTLTAVYWVVLPLLTLSLLSILFLEFSPTVARKGVIPDWVLPLSVLITLMIIWRLWVHDRARRRADAVEFVETVDAPPSA